MKLSGEARVPGDKSVSHRALILGALADGETVVEGLSSGADVHSTRTCLEALGVEISGAAPVNSTPNDSRQVRVECTSAPDESPSTAVSPSASAPRMRARWETDLSPGTRASPLSFTRVP